MSRFWNQVGCWVLILMYFSSTVSASWTLNFCQRRNLSKKLESVRQFWKCAELLMKSLMSRKAFFLVDGFSQRSFSAIDLRVAGSRVTLLGHSSISGILWRKTRLSEQERSTQNSLFLIYVSFLFFSNGELVLSRSAHTGEHTIIYCGTVELWHWNFGAYFHWKAAHCRLSVGAQVGHDGCKKVSENKKGCS